jgi:hypothetical protein
VATAAGAGVASAVSNWPMCLSAPEWKESVSGGSFFPQL